MAISKIQSNNSTHDEMSVDQPATEMQRKTDKITQEESEETSESVKENFSNSLQTTYQLWTAISMIMTTTTEF